MPTHVSRMPKLLDSSGVDQSSLVLEVVKARYGPVTHGVYIVFCCFCNILGSSAPNPEMSLAQTLTCLPVTAMLLTGGSAVIENLTGAPVAATVFLFPLGKPQPPTRHL